MLIPDDVVRAIAASASTIFFGFFLIVAGLFLVKLESRISLRRAQRERIKREVELAGLKASHTNPVREIVI